MNTGSEQNNGLTGSPAISVIVPVYKVEPYLRDCLDSLCAQTFSDVEFLIVDDGSPDNCPAICDEYPQKDSRFRVFHKENGGLSDARNYGIERAKGSYFMYVDSDDCVRPDFCETAYRLAAEKDADLVMFEFSSVKEGRFVPTRRRPAAEGYKSWEEAIDLMLDTNGCVAWSKLYKRELFENIRYPVGRLYEDVATTYKTIELAGRIYYTPQRLYFYRIRKGSIVQTKSLYSMHESFEMHIGQYKALKKAGYPKEKLHKYWDNLCMGYFITIGEDQNDRFSMVAQKTLRSIQGCPRYFTWRRRMLIDAFKVNERLFDAVCIIWRRRIWQKKAT